MFSWQFNHEAVLTRIAVDQNKGRNGDHAAGSCTDERQICTYRTCSLSTCYSTQHLEPPSLPTQAMVISSTLGLPDMDRSSDHRLIFASCSHPPVVVHRDRQGDRDVRSTSHSTTPSETDQIARTTILQLASHCIAPARATRARNPKHAHRLLSCFQWPPAMSSSTSASNKTGRETSPITWVKSD